MIYVNTRLDKVTLGNMAIIDHYTILWTDDETIRISSDSIESNLRSQLTSNSETKRLLEAGVTMSYKYSNEKGEYFISFDVKD